MPNAYHIRKSAAVAVICAHLTGAGCLVWSALQFVRGLPEWYPATLIYCCSVMAVYASALCAGARRTPVSWLACAALAVLQATIGLIIAGWPSNLASFKTAALMPISFPVQASSARLLLLASARQGLGSSLWPLQTGSALRPAVIL